MTSPQVPPNPETPLAFLPPTLAGQLELSHYFTAGTCGVRVSIFDWNRLPTLKIGFLDVCMGHIDKYEKRLQALNEVSRCVPYRHLLFIAVRHRFENSVAG